eukprot:TRINITY_DN33951_c0_g1_i1.p1 TRINITY_DN33951_c0_g1~~TRINITY_DN33951_c0_g1_i1.p1  ORF type:complete len:234 (-),score=63.10 TRINITY_DN33951_c0_g1_i1:74-775(-)
MAEGDASTVADLEADIAELQGMLEKASRASVQKELQRVLTKLQAELKKKREKVANASETSSAPAAQPAAVVVKPTGPWVEITTFAQDLGGYNVPDVTVDVRLKGIENLPKENVTCDFTEASFDLKVVGLDGQNYRFLRTNLEKDIVPAESGVKVKKNHVIVSMRKVKGEFGYDSWMDLTAKGQRKKTTKDGSPQDNIMSMMKDLYDEGDDNLKRTMAEAMNKARTGEPMDPAK